MAEAEQNDKNPSTSPRRPHYQNRPTYPSRGRGRQNNVSVNKAMHLFGVRDLREFLDRKHQDGDYNQAKGGPPPDPSYNYLRDPSRDSGGEQPPHRYHKEHHSGRSSGEQHSARSSGEQHSGRGTGGYQAKPHSFRGSGRGRGRGGAVPKENRHPESEKARFIENPVNIKVELVASTGERNCKIDEETKLADIKHIPNYKLKDLRPSKSENDEGKVYSDRYKHERGRGRWQRGGRGRGRGGRGRGRGGERPQPKRNNDNSESLKETSTAEPSPEVNWDNDSYLKHSENPAEGEDVKEDEVSNENDDREELEEHDEEPEQYYEEGSPESLDVIEQNEDSAGGNITIEENLVITASEEEVRKRTVTFKLEDGKDGATSEDSKRKEEKPVEGGDGKNEQSATTSNN